ncbi:MAG: VCBS repeat-containing protein, partial [Nitrospiria bacterium]
MASADLNRDGWQDLLLTDRVSGQISLLLGEGSGLRPFRPPLLPVRVGNEPRAVTSGHLDTDGIPDLVFANRDSVTAMTRVGVGEVLSSYIFPSDQPTDLSAVAVGDLNGDGIHDVVAADAYPGRSRLWIFLHGVTPGAIPTSIALGALPRALALLDVNGDRALDLVVVNQGDGTIAYQVGDGQGGFGALEILTVGGSPAALVMADVTGDGRPDAIVADPGSGRILILPHSIRPVEGIAVAAVRVDGRVVGDVVYLNDMETGPLQGAVATGRTGRFMIFNVPPGPAWLRLLSGGTGSRFLQAYADGVTSTDFPVVTGPTTTVLIRGATVDAVVRPVGEVQIRFLGTERATSSSPLLFDERGNLAGGASYSTLIEANSDYILRLSK